MEKNLPTKKTDLADFTAQATADFLAKGGEVKVIPLGKKGGK